MASPTSNEFSNPTPLGCSISYILWRRDAYGYFHWLTGSHLPTVSKTAMVTSTKLPKSKAGTILILPNVAPKMENGKQSCNGARIIKKEKKYIQDQDRLPERGSAYSDVYSLISNFYSSGNAIQGKFKILTENMRPSRVSATECVPPQDTCTTDRQIMQDFRKEDSKVLEIHSHD